MKIGGLSCPGCPDFAYALTAKNLSFDVEDPHSDEPAVNAVHTGPTIIAAPGHVLVVYRGHKDPITIGDGQILTLCEGDVVRVLAKEEDDAKG